MSALLFLLRRMLANGIRRIFRKPARLILVILMAAMIAGMIVVSLTVERPPFAPDPKYAGAVMTLLVLLAAWFAVRNGLEKGSTFFRMADVHFVFPSPLPPRHILLYGFVHQLGVSLLTLGILLFQMMNIRNFLGVPTNGLPSFYLGVFLVLLYLPVASMAIYSRVLRHPQRKLTYGRIFAAATAAVGAAYVATTIWTGDPLRAAVLVFDHPAIRWVPVIGWFRTVLAASVNGWDAWAAGSLLLSLAAVAGTLVWLLRSDIDYYEEVLKETEIRESRIRDKRAGKAVLPGPRKIREARWTYRGGGASALFHRQMLEYRKAGFLFVDRTTLFLAAAAVAGGYLLRGKPQQAYILLYAGVYALFLFSFTGKWTRELNKPYIYLIPASSTARIWYATLGSHLKHLADGLVIFTVAGIFGRMHPLTCALLALQYAAFGALFVYADVLFRRWFGTLGNTVAAGILKALLVLLLAVPALAAMVLAGIFFPGGGAALWLAQLASVGYAAAVSLIALLAGRGLFERMECG